MRGLHAVQATRSTRVPWTAWTALAECLYLDSCQNPFKLLVHVRNEMIVPLTTRRQFLQSSTLAIAGATVGALDLRRAFAGDPPSAPSWINKPMRWAQLTLVEDDPGKFDP